MNRKQYILETLNRQNITEVSAMDAIHLGLDAAGMIPGIGIAADLTNAALYGLKGQKGMAGLSLLAAVPGAGLAAGATKIGKGLSKAVKSAAPRSPIVKAVTSVAKGGKGAKTITNPARMLPAAKTAATTSKAAKASKAAIAGAMAGKVAVKAAKGGAKVAAKAAKPAAKAAIQVGSRTIPRAAVLARGDVADTLGFDKGGKSAQSVQAGIPFGVAKGEGQAVIDKALSGIADSLAKVPGATQNLMKKLDDYKLGSFQS